MQSTAGRLESCHIFLLVSISCLFLCLACFYILLGSMQRRLRPRWRLLVSPRSLRAVFQGMSGCVVWHVCVVWSSRSLHAGVLRRHELQGPELPRLSVTGTHESPPVSLHLPGPVEVAGRAHGGPTTYTPSLFLVADRLVMTGCCKVATQRLERGCSTVVVYLVVRREWDGLGLRRREGSIRSEGVQGSLRGLSRSREDGYFGVTRARPASAQSRDRIIIQCLGRFPRPRARSSRGEARGGGGLLPQQREITRNFLINRPPVGDRPQLDHRGRLTTTASIYIHQFTHESGDENNMMGHNSMNTSMCTTGRVQRSPWFHASILDFL